MAKGFKYLQANISGWLLPLTKTVLYWNFLTSLFLLGGILTLGYAFRTPATTGLSVPNAEVKVMAETRGDLASQWVAFDAYASVFSQRDIFRTDHEKLWSEQQSAVTGPDTGATPWAQGYRLLGVFVDNDPRAVIQSLNPPGVHTLAVGQNLGGATLLEVHKNKALFDYQKRTIELGFEENPSN